MKKLFAIGCVAMCAAAGAASANVYTWEWNPGDHGVNNNGGTFHHILARYNTNTQKLLFELTFADQVSNGYTLALNDGPNPKGHAGELALVYFDATNMGDVRTSIYAYNGLNTQTSYLDGSPVSGNQSPDRILSSIDPVAGLAISATAWDHGNLRTFRLELDASDINSHIPMYPGPQGPSEWTGIQFDDLMGIWLHPVKNLSTSYNEAGFLTHWSGTQGWIDGSNFTTDVPAPGFAAITLASGLAGLRRRRR